jgi:hypothetical protein
MGNVIQFKGGGGGGDDDPNGSVTMEEVLRTLAIETGLTRRYSRDEIERCIVRIAPAVDRVLQQTTRLNLTLPAGLSLDQARAVEPGVVDALKEVRRMAIGGVAYEWLVSEIQRTAKP